MVSGKRAPKSTLQGSREEYDGAGLEAFDRPDLDIVNIATAHLLRLSKAVGTRRQQGRELCSYGLFG
jgi:hypothetical protein